MPDEEINQIRSDSSRTIGCDTREQPLEGTNSTDIMSRSSKTNQPGVVRPGDRSFHRLASLPEEAR
jgi:hypothetical protein